MPFLLPLVSAAVALSALLDGAAPAPPVLLDRFESLAAGPGRTWSTDSLAFACLPTNPGDFKLDHLTPEALATDAGHLTITATPRSDGHWSTGLLTTDNTCDNGGNKAAVTTGDVLLAHVRLPDSGSGAWPAVWTWRDDGNEVDVFEWHEDHPDTLELVNHVRFSVHYHRAPAVAPGHWIYIGAHFGERSVTWYAGDSPDRIPAVHSDGTGVGPGFRAHPVVSLSVSNGHWHPRPTDATPIVLGVDCVTIQRPQAGPAAAAPDAVSGTACRSPR